VTRREAIALLATLVASGCRRTGEQAAEAGGSLEMLDFGGDFTLTDHTGREASLRDYRGKVVLVFFGYTTCPDVCPLTMSTIARALELAKVPSADAVQTLFITVDVERDTPAVLAAYVRSFGVPLTGLTGSREAIDAVTAQYNAAYEIVPSNSAAGPAVSHTAYTYLIDRQGRLRKLFRHGDSAELMAEGLRLALREGA